MCIGSNKGKTVNTPGWSAPPSTVATTNLQNMVNNPVDFSVPIRNSYARAEQTRHRSYQSPLGAYTTADVRDKSLREQDQAANQSLGLDLSNAAQESSQNQFNRQATVAGLTAPQFYNASSSQKWTGGDTAGLIASTAGGLLA